MPQDLKTTKVSNLSYEKREDPKVFSTKKPPIPKNNKQGVPAPPSGYCEQSQGLCLSASIPNADVVNDFGFPKLFTTFVNNVLGQQNC